MLSDTLILASPTTTDRDRHTAEVLARWAFAGSGPLSGETIDSFGRQLLEAGAGLVSRDPASVVSGDLKVYEEGGHKFAISQIEVTDHLELADHLDGLRKALEDLRKEQGMDFGMLMITDVVGGSSRLVLQSAPPALDELPFPHMPDGTLDARGVVSRKKQLLPTVLALLEG